MKTTVILVLSHAEVSELLPLDECIPVIRDALVALASGEVHLPLRSIIRPPQAKGVLGLMPSYTSGERPAYGLKAVSVFPGNPAIGKDAHQGAVLLFSGETGELRALMNASAITAIRTAAATAVATDLLARKESDSLAIIGSGVQARTHLLAMAEVRELKHCRVVSRHFEHAQKFANEMNHKVPFAVEPAETVAQALEEADIIVTTTTAREPIVKREWIKPGSHLNLVGACVPNAREADGETMAAASLFVDSRESALNEAGDYILAAREGLIGPDHIRAELGELLIGAKPGRNSAEEITCFKSLGISVEDLFAAEYLYQKAERLKVGTWVEY
jgi:ornithine cyclodeaminase/alanine dehydrogenase-like protein (mu-crystallin family)